MKLKINTYHWLGFAPFCLFIVGKNFGSLPYSWWWLLIFLPIGYFKKKEL